MLTWSDFAHNRRLEWRNGVARSIAWLLCDLLFDASVSSVNNIFFYYEH